MSAYVLSHFSHFWLFVTPWTVAHRQPRILEWVAMPSSRDLPDPGIEPMSLGSPALAAEFFTTSATWEALVYLESPADKIWALCLMGFFGFGSSVYRIWEHCSKSLLMTRKAASLTGAKSQRPKATSATGSACYKGGSDMELYDQADFRCQIYWSRHECCVEGLATSIGEPQSRPLGFWIKNTLLSQRITHCSKRSPCHASGSSQKLSVWSWGIKWSCDWNCPPRAGCCQLVNLVRRLSVYSNNPSHDELTLSQQIINANSSPIQVRSI